MPAAYLAKRVCVSHFGRNASQQCAVGNILLPVIPKEAEAIKCRPALGDIAWCLPNGLQHGPPRERRGAFIWWWLFVGAVQPLATAVLAAQTGRENQDRQVLTSSTAATDELLRRWQYRGISAGTIVQITKSLNSRWNVRVKLVASLQKAQAQKSHMLRKLCNENA